MIKIAIIGSGSEWGRRFGVDILSYDWPEEVLISMMDVNGERLAPIVDVTRKAIETHQKKGFSVEGTTDRIKALEGATFVLSSFAIGGNAYCGSVYANDITIPMKYGVFQSVADTLGPGGIFRTLRTAPVMLSLLDDMEKYCPDAYLLNYVNPMAMLTWIASTRKIKSVGLCHSVQGTSRTLASVLKVPYEEVVYTAAGINHMAWFTEFKWKNQDMLPKLREIVSDKELFSFDPIRADICKYYGYYVTESSRHMSEYVPYYRKSKEILERYNIDESHVPADVGMGVEKTREFLMKKIRYTDAEGRPEKVRRQISGEEPIILEKSFEYAGEIMNAICTGTPTIFNGNVINHGCIENLPDDCCVEIPCTVSKNGITPHHYGKLPSQLAALCQTNINVQRLAVEAVLERDLEKAYYAMLLDPLTSAVCTTEEIRCMFEELKEAEKEYLTCYL